MWRVAVPRAWPVRAGSTRGWAWPPAPPARRDAYYAIDEREHHAPRRPRRGGDCEPLDRPGVRPIRLSIMLLFKREFLPAIRQGLKTQTIRLWKHRRMRPGQRSYIPGAGYITIESVDEVRLEELTDADALPDGFPTADALRAQIAALYPDASASGHRAYRVRFRLLPPEQWPAKKRNNA